MTTGRDALRDLAQTRAGRVRIVGLVLIVVAVIVGVLGYRRMLDNTERSAFCALYSESGGTIGVPREITAKRLAWTADQLRDGRRASELEDYPGPSVEVEMAQYCSSSSNPFGTPALVAGGLGVVVLTVGWIAFGRT